MAKILRRQRLENQFSGNSNGPAIIEVDGDPSIGLGTEADRKSIAMAPDGVYFKSGNLDTDWIKVGSEAGSSAIDSLTRYANFAVTTQNDDGGWNFYDPMKSSAVRDRTDVSFDNQYGATSLALFEVYKYIKDADYVESMRQALQAWVGEAVDPFDRFFGDITEALVCIGGKEGPLEFTDYLNKGHEAFSAEMNFYKTIQRWHDLGNGPNANPPVGNGADGNLLDVWTNDNAAVLAVPIEQVATRMNDRLALTRPPGLRIYDFFNRITIARCLDDVGLTLNDGGAGDVFGDFALALANIAKDTVWPAIDPQAFWVTIGEATAGLIFKIYEAEAGFAVALDTVLTKIKGDLQVAGIASGFYAVEDLMNLGTYFSGDKTDQGLILQLFAVTGEDELATNLITNLLAIQNEGGHYMDFFDIDSGEQYFQEGAANVAVGITECIRVGII